MAYYAGGATHFEHQDWLGTERMRTSYNGGVVGSYTSLPFGDGYAASGADWDANHYAQLDQDLESGTAHAQFRQYSNAQGRWFSPDPYSGSYSMRNPQSMNRYSYVLNNPLTWMDVLGLDGPCEPGVWTYVPGDAECYTTVSGAGNDIGSGWGGSWRFSDVKMIELSLSEEVSGNGKGSGTAPNNAPLTPEQLHKQQQTKLNQKCAAATASSAALATTAGLNEGAALLTGEITPFAAIFHGIAVVEGIGAGGVGIYAAFACYNAAQF